MAQHEREYFYVKIWFRANVLVLTDLSLLTGTPRLLPNDAILENQYVVDDVKSVAKHYV